MAKRKAAEAEPCERLEWDSEFFGVETARVRGDKLTAARVKEIDAWCGARKIAWLYFLGRADDAETARCAERGGFGLVDVRVTYERMISGDFEGAAGVEAFTDADLPELLTIAQSGYVDSRFYYDGRIPRETCGAFFENWTLQSCVGGADRVLVVREGKAVGYVTCHVDAKTGWGRIGLIAVAPSARGKGVGARLVNGALAWATEEKLAGMTVVTQGRNLAAQRLYQRSGFIMQSLQLYYHKWYD